MRWTVRFHEDFDKEFAGLPESVQDELLAQSMVLEQFGPTLGRPRVDTLKGSRHANMKELRFDAEDGVWRPFYSWPATSQAGASTGSTEN